MAQVGTQDNPLRIAIIGSGPSGFYAAEYLEKQKNLVVEIDMYDRLPTPYGLVRGGVAPDHQKIKSVTKVYDRIAQAAGFRFFGNVTFGKDIHLADLQQLYHAVIFAVGAQTDKRLDIPGEDLPGSHAATEFVGWYNGHPDYKHLSFDLSQETAVVIGVGNVAMDVTRILARTQDELDRTDIADYAQEALKHSRVKDIYVLGRRGPAQAAFTNPEIKELGEMEGADCIVTPDEVALDEYSAAYLKAPGADSKDVKNVAILTGYAGRAPAGKPRRIILRFLTAPVELIGTDRVEAIKIVKNEAYRTESGEIRARATDRTEIIPAGLVFRSVGYYGVALPGVPFYDKWGIIPNDKGRVLTAHHGGSTVTGEYVVGWIKRGPSGIIGTNKPDSIETVEQLLADVQAGQLWSPAQPQAQAVDALLAARGVQPVSFADWLIIDGLEQARAAGTPHPRLKFTSIEAMLNALAERKA
ncbi:MAG: FAD-dependent oxidoreductase [Anaerolineae bacterium]|nr:FAD-dependent oxidoreductase [Anaerolineae bacterium]